MIFIKGTWENCTYFLNQLTWFLCRVPICFSDNLKERNPYWKQLEWDETVISENRPECIQISCWQLMANKIGILEGTRVTVNSWWSPLLLSSFCEKDLKCVGSSTSMLWVRLKPAKICLAWCTPSSLCFILWQSCCMFQYEETTGAVNRISCRQPP